jgi:hypothetical protein
LNKIVREHYPVSSLPEDLRLGLDPTSYVRIVIDGQEDSIARKKALTDMLAAADRIPPISDDPVARIRELRDEWDD